MELLFVANAPTVDEMADADRIWFAILFPAVAGFASALVSIGVLTRDDIAKDPVPSLGFVVLGSAIISLPAIFVNALVFRKGHRTRAAWLVRGVPTAVFLTLTVLAVLCGFFWFVRLGMTH